MILSFVVVTVAITIYFFYYFSSFFKNFFISSTEFYGLLYAYLTFGDIDLCGLFCSLLGWRQGRGTGWAQSRTNNIEGQTQR